LKWLEWINMSDRAWAIVILITWLAVAMELLLRRWERRRIRRKLLKTLNRYGSYHFAKPQQEEGDARTRAEDRGRSGR